MFASGTGTGTGTGTPVRALFRVWMADKFGRRKAVILTGLYTVGIAIVREFVPARKRGWITGLTTNLLPVGTL